MIIFECGYSWIYSVAGLQIQRSGGVKGKWSGTIHNYGNNCTVSGSCDIDVFSTVVFVYNPKEDASKGGWLWVSGSVEGDRFPANEHFVTDQYGKKVMLGVSGVDSDWKLTAPFSELCGEGGETMSNWSFTIEMDGNDRFTAVWFNKKYNTPQF